ncbi:hypothetical protein MANES_06G094500v8 [Manihot esculenta]|uniref:Uncharacterized protein n=1 Tax=Manihot esculenta TaxID=3983 RepID=A0ACB7HNM7_MANES|nr:hypothetical protein MANES_06G094500v8 [Manihot esculenta]
MPRRRSSGALTEDDINELIFKLQALLPQLNQRQASRKICALLLQASASRVLKETCRYIRKLRTEVDGLSERLSQLLDSMDISNIDIESLVISILQQ